jgi:hypothetical protein
MPRALALQSLARRRQTCGVGTSIGLPPTSPNCASSVDGLGSECRVSAMSCGDERVGLHACKFAHIVV